MNVLLITVGKIKEDYLRSACAEYEKRLGAFCRFSAESVEAERLSDNPSEGEIEIALKKEGERIIKKIPPNAYIVALCIEGKEIDSRGLSKMLESAAVNSSLPVFIIGSSFGLSDIVKEKADFKLSMSKMTFPHQLARVMLCEQIYRGFSILNNRKYHK